MSNVTRAPTAWRSLHEPLHDYRTESAKDMAPPPGQRGRQLRSKPSFSFEDYLHYRPRPAETGRLTSWAVTPALLSSR